MKFGVVVLNYNDYCSTLSCVRSLLACLPAPDIVVVVDNHSPNKSFRVLKEKLLKYSSVEVLDSGRNGGYSYGNNFGIRWLLKKGVDHVVIATSDTEVLSIDISSQLNDIIKPNVGLIGPRIYSPKGQQNPSLEQLTLKYIVDLAWMQYGMPAKRVRHCLMSLVKTVLVRTGRKKLYNDHSTNGEHLVVRPVYKLHGSFFCLTKYYFIHVGLLDERIFMFGEEDLIAWKCEKNGLYRLVVDTMSVKHHDDSSINATWGDDAGKFIARNEKKSGYILQQEISLTWLLWRWIYLFKPSSQMQYGSKQGQ